MGKARQFMRASGPDLILEILVSPRASATKIVGIHDGRLKIAVAAPPDANQANEALIEFVRELLSLPASRVVLSSGHRSRKKSLTLNNIDYDSVAKVLKLPN